MATAQALIVPIRLDTLVVTDATRTGGSFRRWTPTFKQLKRMEDPEPGPFDEENFSDLANHRNNGVYLHWRLPEKLCQGTADPHAPGGAAFPKIPNRWLVIRYSSTPAQPEATASCAWVVESDYVGSDGTSEFVEPATLRSTGIGRKTELTAATTWSEPDATRDLFLDVLGPGLLTFSAYQPYNEDVLSLHDKLPWDWQLAPTKQEPGPQVTVSYCVLGWYSNPAFDASRTDRPAEALAALDWTASHSPAQLDGAVFYGTALALPASGPTTADARPDADNVRIAIGGSMRDAVAALGTPRPAAQAASAETTAPSQLLNGLLAGTLEHLGTPDLLIKTDHSLHAAAFGPTATTVRWKTRRREDAPEPDVETTAGDEDLARLNTAQTTAWQHTRALDQLRQRLVDVWRLRAQATLAAADKHQSSAARAQAEKRKSALDTVLRDALKAADDRREATKTALETCTALEHQARKAVGAAGLELGSTPRDAYYQPQDPTIVIRGGGVDQPLTQDGPLPCRFAAEARTGLLSHTAPAEPPGIAHTALLPAHLRPAAAAALTEFAVLDACTRDTTGEHGSLLDDVLTDPKHHALAHTLSPYTARWTPPWSPLFLLWTMRCTPITYRSGTTDCWSFDGLGFGWKGTGDQAECSIANRSAIAPLPGFHLSRAADGLARRRSGDTDAYLRFRDEAMRADLLSQSLDGINAWFLQRKPMLHLQPTADDPDDLARQVARHLTEPGAADRPARVPQPSCADADKPVFQPIRAGQMYLDSLSIVDRFGQSADLMKPQQEVRTSTPPRGKVVERLKPYLDKVVELPPRLLHPARLCFEAADPDTDLVPPPGTSAGVAGWLVPNHLDRSLVLYETDGSPRLELRHGPLKPSRLDLPRSTPRPADDELPKTLTRLLTYLNSLDTEDFTQVRQALDTGLSTVRRTDQDTATLATLCGRPLALVRARLGIELDGPPPGPTGWDTVRPDPDPDILNQQWPLRLGEADLTEDGLIGYFLDDDTTQLRTYHVQRTDSTSAHLRPLTGTDPELHVASAVAPLTTGRHVTLIVDPWCPVHAVTDLLPVHSFRLPEDVVRAGLDSLGIPFATDPLLTPPDRDSHTVVMPRPSAFHGRWQWAQRNAAASWDTADDLAPASSDASIPAAPVKARAGFLQLREPFARYRVDS
ncbi:hypothetical protein H8N00_07590 [Streptomyces sp. AC563]|uniref:hypothetical protein n=1 Tax=Streptomyces buecherae TaxID=2763006 RepID=UPI00164CDFCE|nr:hypothetical protein [Streptomyces buecherae]MBC3988751.1 hypothetical protein [Streptomyces buecherae]